MPPRGVTFLACTVFLLCACSGSDDAYKPSPNLSLPATASIDTDTILASAGAGDPAPQRTVLLSVSHLPPVSADSMKLSWSWSHYGIDSVRIVIVDEGQAEIRVEFQQPDAGLAGHTIHDVVDVRVCYDEACAIQASGSPFRIYVWYSILDASVPEPGIVPLNVLSRTELRHDVLDALFSPALNAIVMISGTPRDALHVYDLALGQEYEVLLSRTPTALSLDPDGLTAAVGHEGLVSLIDLNAVGDPGAAPPVQLEVSVPVQDLVLDPRGYVHIVPKDSSFDPLHSVAIATGIEHLSEDEVHSVNRAVLHPSEPHLYLTHSTNRSPTDIEKFDVSTGIPARMYDSPYHGQHPMCGNLWIHEIGAALYTACGNTFATADAAANDLLYAGRLELSPSAYDAGSRILSLSQSETMKEILVIEGDHHLCEVLENTAACHTRLNIYHSDSLHRTGQYGIPGITIDGQAYPQRGMFVFHGVAGAQWYLISRLHGPSAPAQHYLSVLQ